MLVLVAFSALTVSIGWQEVHPACKNGEMVEVGTDWSRRSGAQLDGRCVCLCYPLHHKVQKFFSGTRSPGLSRKKGRKMVVVVVHACTCCMMGLFSNGESW